MTLLNSRDQSKHTTTDGEVITALNIQQAVDDDMIQSIRQYWEFYFSCKK